MHGCVSASVSLCTWLCVYARAHVYARISTINYVYICVVYVCVCVCYVR